MSPLDEILREMQADADLCNSRRTAADRQPVSADPAPSYKFGQATPRGWCRVCAGWFDRRDLRKTGEDWTCRRPSCVALARRANGMKRKR